MATATQVTIKVVVDGAQAGPAIDGINAKLGEIGVKGTASMGQAGAAVDKLGGHVATGLDSVRLLSQEFGLRMPRAIEAMLSRMPAVVGFLSNTIGLMAGIAAIEIFTRAIDGAVKLYREFFDVNAALREYEETAGKAATHTLLDDASLETAVSLLKQANEQVDQLQSKRQIEAQRPLDPSVANFGNIWARSVEGMKTGAVGTSTATFTKDQGKDLAQGMADAATATQRSHELANKYALEELKNNNESIEKRLAGENLIAQKKKDEKAVADEVYRQQQQRETDLVNTAKVQRAAQIADGMKLDDPKLTPEYRKADDAGTTERRLANQKADQDAAAEEAKLGQETGLAIMKARDAAAQSGLQGEELYFRKMQDDIRELTVELTNQGKAAEIPAHVREINEKYFNDLSERAVKAQNESGLAIRRAGSSGLTGAARIYADQDTAVSENNTKYAGDPEREHSENVAAATTANQKLTELQQQFTERMESIEESRVGATLSGYARIDAEAAKTAHSIEDEFNKSFGGANVDQNSAQYIAAKKAEQDALTANAQGSLDQRTAYQQKQDEETLRYDQQAAEAQRRVKSQGLLSFVADYQSAMDEIRAKDAEQTKVLADELNKREIDEQTFARRKADVDAEANAQIAAQNQQMQHQIASDLQQAFTNPLEFIKSRMEQWFFDLVASWIMHLKIFQSAYGSIMGGLVPGGPAGGGAAAPAAAGLPGIAGTRGVFGGRPSVSAGTGSSGAAAAVNVGADYSTSYSGGGSGGGTSSSSGYTPHSPAYTGGASSGGGAVAAAQSVAGSARGIYQDVSAARAQIAARSASTAIPTIAPGVSSSAMDTGLSGSFSDAAGVPGPASGPPSIDGTGLAMPGPSGAPSITGVPSGPGAAPAGATGASKIAGTGMAIAGAGVAGYEGYQDTAADFKSGSAGGTLKGMFGDAMAGAAIGSLFGPVGTLVGAGVGAAVGLVAGVTGAIMGEGGRLAARDYYKKSLFPEIESERNGGGQSDFQSAISQVNRISSDGMIYMAKKWGAGAAQWVNDNYLKKEQELADSELLARAKGGAQYVSMSAAQFHSGGRVTGFGDFGTSSDEGFIHAKLSEAVMNPAAVSMHGSTLDAMNSGASPSDVARMYLAGSQQSSASAGGGGVTHQHQWNVQTMDSKSFDNFLGSGNNARTMVKHVNKFASSYAGDGVSG